MSGFVMIPPSDGREAEFEKVAGFGEVGAQGLPVKPAAVHDAELVDRTAPGHVAWQSRHLADPREPRNEVSAPEA